jgi:hypothetical protein
MEHDSTVYPYLYEQNKALHIGSMNTALKEDLSPRENQREEGGGGLKFRKWFFNEPSMWK